MPIISGSGENQSNNLGTVLAAAINAFGAKAVKDKQDKMYRKAAAAELGVPEDQIPLGLYNKDNLDDILKQKHAVMLKKQLRLNEVPEGFEIDGYNSAGEPHYKRIKPESASDAYKSDVAAGVARIQAGEDPAVVENDLKAKHPTQFNDATGVNLDSVGQASRGVRVKRIKATNILKQRGFPLTEANIKALMDQIK